MNNNSQEKKVNAPIGMSYREDIKSVVVVANVRLDEVSAFCEALTSFAESCNVAKRVNPRTALFDTSSDPNVFHVDIDEKTLTDFQTMRKAPGEDVRKTLLALIEYYNNNDALNIILLPDVLESRPSYAKFTAQLGHYLTHNQREYLQVKVQFDNLESRLGIFCRKGTEASSLNSTFLGSVVASLRAYGSAEVDLPDVPMSYVTNKAAFKQALRQRLNKPPKIFVTRESVKIFV